MLKRIGLYEAGTGEKGAEERQTGKPSRAEEDGVTWRRALDAGAGQTGCTALQPLLGKEDDAGG